MSFVRRVDPLPGQAAIPRRTGHRRDADPAAETPRRAEGGEQGHNKRSAAEDRVQFQHQRQVHRRSDVWTAVSGRG